MTRGQQITQDEYRRNRISWYTWPSDGQLGIRANWSGHGWDIHQSCLEQKYWTIRSLQQLPSVKSSSERCCPSERIAIGLNALTDHSQKLYALGISHEILMTVLHVSKRRDGFGMWVEKSIIHRWRVMQNIKKDTRDSCEKQDLNRQVCIDFKWFFGKPKYDKGRRPESSCIWFLFGV